MFFSQLRPVQFSQPKKLSSSRWPKPSDSSLGLKNSPVQNHFPSIFQLEKSPPIGWLGDPRGRSKIPPVSQALPVPPRFLGKLLPVLPEEQELARVARRGWKDGGLSPESIRKCGFYHDLTMIEPWNIMKPWKTMGWTWLNLIEQLGSCFHPKEILVYSLAI